MQKKKERKRTGESPGYKLVLNTSGPTALLSVSYIQGLLRKPSICVPTSFTRQFASLPTYPLLAGISINILVWTASCEEAAGSSGWISQAWWDVQGQKTSKSCRCRLNPKLTWQESPRGFQGYIFPLFALPISRTHMLTYLNVKIFPGDLKSVAHGRKGVYRISPKNTCVSSCSSLRSLICLDSKPVRNSWGHWRHSWYLHRVTSKSCLCACRMWTLWFSESNIHYLWNQNNSNLSSCWSIKWYTYEDTWWILVSTKMCCLTIIVTKPIW